MPKCMSCHKAIVVITGRVHFHENIYIYIYIYIYMYMYIRYSKKIRKHDIIINDLNFTFDPNDGRYKPYKKQIMK